MIRWQRLLQHKQGKWSSAVRWAKQIAAYFNERYPETQVEVFTARFGPLNTVYWMADFEDLAAQDRWQKKVWGDEGYQALLGDALDAFIEASIVDTVLESA